MALPNPGMDAVPFTPLTAEFLDDMIENIESLSDGTGIGDAAVTASKIDFTSGIWWEEIGRSSLGSNAASLSVTFTPKKYIKVICNGVGVGTSSFGAYVDFNNDTGATNYGRRLIQSTSSSVAAQTSSTRAIFYVTHSFSTGGFTFTLEGAGKPIGTSNYFNVQGGTVTEVRTGVANWTGAANITTVRIIQDTAIAGSLIGAGTEIIVLGHD